jgi:hypothetical protein
LQNVTSDPTLPKALYLFDGALTWNTPVAAVELVQLNWTLARPGTYSWPLINTSKFTAVPTATFASLVENECTNATCVFTQTATQLQASVTVTTSGQFGCPCVGACAAGYVCGDVSRVCIVEVDHATVIQFFFALLFI